MVSPFFSFRVVRDEPVGREGFVGTAFSYMGQ